MNYKKINLKNGLRIITVPMAETQTVTVVAMVGVGSRYENEKEAGLSHFIEHMFFKGTEKRPTALSISEELDAIGGEFNAFTSKDSTGYYVKVDAKHIETALDVVSDIYLNSKIEEAEVEKERGTIIQELHMYEDMPMRSVGDVFESLLYPGTFLGRDIIGYKETIEKFKRADFLKYMKRFYLSNDTVICVAGKFDEKKIVDQISIYFREMTEGKKPEIKMVKESQKNPAVKIKFKKTDQTQLVIGVRAYDLYSEKRFALSLLSIILGGNMSSRLFIEVRERRGLAYYVRTNTESFEECGYLATQAGVEHKNLTLAIKTILSEYKKIAEEKVSEKELKKSKDYIKGKMVMGMEASDEVAMFFVGQELTRKEILEREDIFKRIDLVTVDDILLVAKEIFQNKRLNLAIIGPHKNSEKLQKMLIV
ncbi:MAG: pitrilysin family protein [Candidatus Moraniibacteriota bacterium]|jgi:predicted Zn-dependent peptidase